MQPQATTATARQLAIDWTPPALGRVPLRSRAQRALLRDIDRRSSRAAELLRRLRQGPATTLEAAAVAGLRYSARLHELRSAGYVIRTIEDHGRWTYELIGEPAR